MLDYERLQQSFKISMAGIPVSMRPPVLCSAESVTRPLTLAFSADKASSVVSA